MLSRLFFILGLASFSFITSSVSAKEKRFFSQCGQDSYLYKNVFKGKHRGVFVDIGANDGITLSNTYFFEKYRKWTGVCVEPIPEIFAKLRAQRRCICIQGCVSDTSGIKPFLRLFGPEMLSGLLEKYEPRHLEWVKRELEKPGTSSQIIQMPCFTFNELLANNKIKHVDYLSIDTEGGELDILKSIDFTRFKIDIIDVENNYKDPLFETFMRTAGYAKIATLEQDEIYQLIQ